jgi:hypothetical protein
VIATGEAAAAEDFFEQSEDVRDEGERTGDGEEKPKTKGDK